LKQVKTVSKSFTLILDDPVANSYLQNIYAPDPDPNMRIEWYERTKEQDDELGISDMKVEGYEDDLNLADEEIGDGHALEPVKEEPEEVGASAPP
jgi:zinc finger protein